MITLNQTAGDDNKLIFLYYIELDSGAKRYSDKNITLSSNNWVSNVIARKSFVQFSKSIDVVTGGGLGSVGNSQFAIPKDNTDSLTQDFINSFYPVVGEDIITSRYISIGFVWQGATLESQITWLQTFYIENQLSNYSLMTYPLAESSELDTIQMPPYRIQKDDNDGISYYPLIDDELVGQTIPIYYGDFFKYLTDSERRTGQMSGYAHTIPITRSTSQFLVCCHECYDIADTGTNSNMQMLKYLPSINNFALCSHYPSASGDTSYTNNFFGHKIVMITPEKGGEIRGHILHQLRGFGDDISTASDVDNVIDKDETNYGLLTHSNSLNTYWMNLKPTSSVSSSDLGYITINTSPDQDNVSLNAIAEPLDGTTLVGLSWQDNTVSPATSDYDTTSMTVKATITLDFNNNDGATTEALSAEEVFRRVYYINTDPTVTEGWRVRVYNMWLELKEIKLYSLAGQPKKITGLDLSNIAAFGQGIR